MAKKKDNPEALGVARRSIWFMLRAVLIVSLLLGLIYACFTEGMYISNMYSIVTEGMKLRAETVLENGPVSDLKQYFTEDFLNSDALLNSAVYQDYSIDTYEYRYTIKGISVMPWSKSGTVTYIERIPTIAGSPKSDDIAQPLPRWTSMLYKIRLKKVEGRWLISELMVVEVEPMEEALPTPDYSQLTPSP